MDKGKKAELEKFLEINMAPVMTRRVEFEQYSHAANFVKDLLREDWTFSNALIKESWCQIDKNYDSDNGSCDLQAIRDNGVIVEFQYIAENSNSRKHLTKVIKLHSKNIVRLFNE